MTWWLVQNLIVTAALAVVVFFVCRLRQIGPAGRHVLWTIVLIKLLTPPLVFWPWSVPGFSQTATTAEATTPTSVLTPERSRLQLTKTNHTPSEKSPTENVVVHSETIVVPRDTIEAESSIAAETSDSAPTPHVVERSRTATKSNRSEATIGWWAILTAVWATGSLIVLVVNAVRIVRMHRRLQEATVAPSGLQEQVARWARQLGIRKPPVLVIPELSSPVIWAAGRPVLLWPEPFANDADFRAWQGVVVHELAHLKRRDHWVGWLELFAVCLWWWNPLLWIVCNRIHENAELACDAWVIGTLPDGRRAYAEALIHVCDRLSQTPAALPAAPAVGAVSSRRHLERRLTMILKETVPFRASWSVMLAVIVLGLIALPGWTQSKNGIAKTPKNTATPVAAQSPAGRTGDPLLSKPRRNPTAAEPPAIDVPKARNVPARTTKELQQRIIQLQKQIEDLKKAKMRPNPTVDPRPARPARYYPLVGAAVPKTTTELVPARTKPRLANRGFANTAPAKPAQPVVATDTITLQRTTYRLPASRAKALSEFLRTHVKAEVLHTEIIRIPVRVSRSIKTITATPDSYSGAESGLRSRTVVQTSYQSQIRITTTPDVQKMIGLLISSMRKDEPAKMNDAFGHSEDGSATDFDSSNSGYRPKRAGTSFAPIDKNSSKINETLAPKPKSRRGKSSRSKSSPEDFESGAIPGDTGAPLTPPTTKRR